MSERKVGVATATLRHGAQGTAESVRLVERNVCKMRTAASSERARRDNAGIEASVDRYRENTGRAENARVAKSKRKCENGWAAACLKENRGEHAYGKES